MTITKTVLKVRKEFDMNSLSSCKFHHSQWEECRQGSEHVSIPYAIYRLLFMIILISSMTFSTLCQSYLFEIFLTNWSFTLQTIYGVLFAFNILWKMRRSLMQSLCMKYYHVHPVESNGKAYELKETNSSWDNNKDTNSMIVNENDGKNGVVTVNIGNGNNSVYEREDQPQQQQLDSTTGAAAADLTTDSSPSSVIIINSNNNNNNKSRCNDDPPSVLEKVIWILMNASHVLPYIVTLGYWIFVYKYDPDQKSCERFRSHFIVHGATSLLAFVDSMVVAIPARKSHFVFPSFILLVYCVFSGFYELAGGPYREGKEFIYSILNWRHKPGRTIVIVIVGIIASPLTHLIACWGAHHVKLWLVSWFTRRKDRK